MTETKMNPDSLEEEENLRLNALELAGNMQEEDEQDVALEDTETVADRTDYSTFSKNDFVQKSGDLVHSSDLNQAHETFKKMRVLFDDIVRKDRELQLKEFVEAGNEPRDFRVGTDDEKNKFYQNYTLFLEKRANEKLKAEQEKHKNLLLKKEILEKIKVLTETEETEQSLQDLKELQREWKQISRIPKDQMHELWETYRFLLDKFYDQLSIFNELKELDRQKNLEAKIELTKKVGELVDEKSIKKSHILLNKYHEDFKNVGPVPKEFSDDVWNRFKDASDKIIERNKERIEELKDKRRKNLEIKTILCEKVEQIAAIQYKTIKEWNEQVKQIELVFSEWKSTGPVPDAVSDQIWKRFRDAQNVFYKNRKEYFQSINKDKEQNYKIKLQLCEQAEKVSESTDFEKTTLQLIQLQEKWKGIGPVPEKHSEEIWQRFRTACDSFFKRRDINRGLQKEEEIQNYTLKSALLTKLETLLNTENTEDTNTIFNQLREIQKEWNTIGFVPKNKFMKVKTKYESLSDEILKKHNLSTDNFKQSRLKEHLEMLANKPNGNFALKTEERKTVERIKTIASELETYQNNIEFFASSKSANALKLQFEEKIQKSKVQLEKLEAELKLIRGLMR
jgi:hypothetical protein